MWNSGHWWVPTLDGMPYFHKPPLFYWLTGLVYGLSGGCIEATRLVSWAAGLCAMAVLAAMMRRHLQQGERERQAGPCCSWPACRSGTWARSTPTSTCWWPAASACPSACWPAMRWNPGCAGASPAS